jgi:hypothetical protein
MQLPGIVVSLGQDDDSFQLEACSPTYYDAPKEQSQSSLI